MSTLRRAAVVIPAHNEEALLARCLTSVCAAVDLVHRIRPDLRTQVVLVLDRCTDGSAAIARTFPAVHTLGLDAGCVGRARAAGVDAALASMPRPERSWVACTDADSQVPASWLVHHVGAAERGIDLLIGAVHPDPDDLQPETLGKWRARHRLGGPHDHVFGANLGVRASTYAEIGGFPGISVGEDVALVAAAREHHARVAHTARASVLTSGRHAGRAPDGFAAYLRELDRSG
ncbi:glycosyltransferase [Calidifontibacter sp. DB0510]|uniref:4,4'-diaponeurosporenoate glycosyltransferase n=1 Tax=Metallococcus carri TaxID=1656884 RepID=A0A967B393_9MICO|nr:glycosyltransferase [Metallococcus carri]NHN54852.1 glycosyltransferase [Metallococcus carri]NOP37197.1 glycosyltransferase [Calidifontibacter sp. DB2511S]